MRGQLATAVILFVLFAVALVYATNSQPVFQFNTTQYYLDINWTNSYKANISINVTNSTPDAGLILAIVNSTSTLRANYSQPVAAYGSVCGDTPASGIKIIVGNETAQNFSNLTANITNTTMGNMTLYPHQACPAGRYFGYINITNATGGAEWVQLNITYNIPISTNNTLSNVTGLGSYSGILPANATGYQAYFFNASQVSNASGVYVNFSWTNASTADVDIFLLNSTGGVVARSVNRVGSESLFTNVTDQFYEIRIYGNSTAAINYTDQGGWIYVSTLNATNTSNAGQFVKEIHYDGTWNLTNSLNYTNITIINNGSVNYTSISETKEIFKLDIFGANESKNFTLIVPNSSITSKVQSTLNWTGGANFTIKMYNPAGTLVDSSFSKRTNANMSGVEVEDYVETTTITPGLWRIEVTNSTTAMNPYNVSVRTYYANASSFITTNFSTASINGNNYANSSLRFHVNMTIPNTTLNGRHQGFLKYSTSSGEVFRIPISLNVTVPILAINNTIGTDSYVLIDNIGFNRTLYNWVNISINNTGHRPLTIADNISDLRLRHTSNSSLWVDFNFSYPSTAIAPNSSGTLTLNFTINTVKTTNTQGIYRGYIYVNATDAAPYKTFNLTVDVNLTSLIKLNFDQVFLPADGLYPGYIKNGSNMSNISLEINPYFINDSATRINVTNLANFSSFYIQSNNVTSFTNTSLMFYNYTTDLFPGTPGTGYRVNVTIPAHLPGGNYSVFGTLTTGMYGGVTLSGVGSNNSVYINNTGLYLQANSSSLTVAANANGYYNVSIINYGSMDSTGTLTPLSLDTSIATVLADTVYSHTAPASPGNCGTVASGGGSFTGVAISAHAAETCIYQVKVTGKNISASSDVTIRFSTSSVSYGNHTTVVSVTGTGSSGAGGGGSSSTNSTPTPSKQYKMKLSVPERIEIVQGNQRSMSADVNNTGDAGHVSLVLSGSGIDSSWFSISPSSYSLLGVSDTKTFTVSYTIPANALVKDYVVTFNASSQQNSTTNQTILRVLPSESTKNSTNSTIQNISSIVDELEEIVEDLDNSSLDSDLNSIKSKLTEAQNLANGGDFFGAQQKINEANAAIESLRSKLSGAFSQGANGSFLKVGYIVLGVLVIAFVGVLAYLLVPPKEGYHPEKGYRHVTMQDKQAHIATKAAVDSIGKKIKSFFMKKE